MQPLKKVWPRSGGNQTEASKAKNSENILADKKDVGEASFPFSPKKIKPRRGFAAYEDAKQPLLDCPLTPTEYMRLCKRAARKARV